MGRGDSLVGNTVHSHSAAESVTTKSKGSKNVMVVMAITDHLRFWV